MHRTSRRARHLRRAAAIGASPPPRSPRSARRRDPAAPLSGIDLSNYVRVGRYDLPEPTRTTAPTGNLLAQESSGVAYNPDTGTLFVVGDGGTSVTQVTKTGQLVDTMTLPAGSSPQGTEFYDTEGIAYVGGGQFVFTEERDRQLVKFTYARAPPSPARRRRPSSSAPPSATSAWRDSPTTPPRATSSRSRRRARSGSSARRSTGTPAPPATARRRPSTRRTCSIRPSAASPITPTCSPSRTSPPSRARTPTT